MKKLILTLILFSSISYMTTNNAMNKTNDELGGAPYNQGMNEYFDLLKTVGHTAGLYTLKGVRAIVCGSNYGLAQENAQDDTPYNHPTIEDSVWKYTTKKITIIEAIERKHKKTA